MRPDRTERNPWDRMPAESQRAYQAFAQYRNYGYQRSLVKVYRQFKGIPERNPVIVPSHWNQWSVTHNWVKRSDAFDAHRDAIEQHEADKEFAHTAGWIARRQSNVERERQLALEDQIPRIDAVLKKAETAPIVDETTNVNKTDTAQDGTVTVTQAKLKKKGINYSGFARLMQELREQMSEAGWGPRHQKATKVELSGKGGGPLTIALLDDILRDPGGKKEEDQ